MRGFVIEYIKWNNLAGIVCALYFLEQELKLTLLVSKLLALGGDDVIKRFYRVFHKGNLALQLDNLLF